MDLTQGQPVDAVELETKTTPMGELHASSITRRTRRSSTAHVAWRGVVSLCIALLGVACEVDPDLPPAPPPVDPPGPLCPKVDPITGPFAMKGACCYRASNAERIAQSQDGKAVLEFRIMASQVVSQPRTVGSAPFLSFVQHGYDTNRSVSLIRIHDFPTQPPGEVVIETGPGRFNADGTYSFLKDAAPITDVYDQISRWDSITTDAYYDPDAPEGERFVPLDEETARQLVVTPEWRNDGKLDYELPQYAPNVRSMTFDDDLNCVGERGDSTRWITYDEIQSFVPLAEASATILSTGWSLCTSIAFGFLVLGGGTCEATPRQEWVELPTALCVDGACHVGFARDDEAPADCRTDPTASNDERPMCCDALAVDPVLPACNAFHVRARYVAAAVEITDEPVSDGAPIQINTP